MARTLILTSIGACVLGAGMIAAGPKIKREDNNAQRAALIELETSPMPVELFDGLTEWSLGQRLTGESIKGKVVVIATIAADQPQSLMMLNTLARLEREHADEGLVALAVHGELGWDALQQKVLDGRVKVQVAKDGDGAFVSGLHVDNHPDVFIIDRAGQLRYADVANKSIKPAVVGLLKEDAETAIANAQLEASGVEIPDPGMPEISTEQYASAAWPSVNPGKLNALDFQGKALPVALGNEKWLTKKVDLEGKVVVLDFWATWCGPCRKAMPELDRLQKQYRDELVVMGVGGQSDPIADVKNFIRSHKESYSQVYDKDQGIYRAMQIRAIPHVVILSTDGVIRWQGNPLSRSFKTTLEQVIAADPLVQALSED